GLLLRAGCWHARGFNCFRRSVAVFLPRELAAELRDEDAVPVRIEQVELQPRAVLEDRLGIGAALGELPVRRVEVLGQPHDVRRALRAVDPQLLVGAGLPQLEHRRADREQRVRVVRVLVVHVEREQPELLLVPLQRELQVAHSMDDGAEDELRPRRRGLAAHSAGTKTGSATVSSSRCSSRNDTFTGMSQRTSSGATPSMFDVIRTPSSSSTIATTYGTRSLNGGRSFWCTTVNVYTRPRPVDSFQEVSADQHLGQYVRG